MKETGPWYTRGYFTVVQQLSVLLFVLAGLVFVVGLAVQYGGLFQNSILGAVLLDFYVPISTNSFGVAVTILLVEDLYRRHSTREKKRQLVLQLGSPDNAFALDAVRKLRALGWVEDGTLQGAVLIRANLANAPLAGANLTGCNLEQAILVGADLRGSQFAGSNMRAANLSGADLTQASLVDVDLVYANMRKAILISVDLENAGLLYAHLEGTRLISANLVGTDLSGAHLEAANLQGANLEGADLRGVDLAKVDLSKSIGQPLRQEELFVVRQPEIHSPAEIKIEPE